MKQYCYRSRTPVLGQSLFDFNIPQPQITSSSKFKIRHPQMLKKICPEQPKMNNILNRTVQDKKNLKYLFINVDVDIKLSDSESEYHFRSMPKQKVIKQKIQRRSYSVKEENLEMTISNLDLKQRPFCKQLRSISVKNT